MLRHLIQTLPGLLLCVALSSCGPKVIMSDTLKEGSPKALAVLPVNYPSGVQRERVDYLRSALVSELKSRGFIVLDDSAVNLVCPDAECPNASELSSKYLADGYVTLHLDSVARNNFLAGYYNAITGKMTLQDRNRRDLLEVSHTESERGGLLFNSGQLIQGVISQLNNSEKDSFARLADKFSKTLVSKIPRPKASQFEDEGNVVSIKSVRLTPSKAGAEDLCVSGTPQAMAFVLLPGQRSNLREVRPGEYCSRLRISDIPSDMSTISVEVRSAYGSSVRQSLKSDVAPCDLDGLISVRSQGSSKSLVLSCAPSTLKCDDRFQSCGAHRFIIYRALTPLGPFTKVAEVRDLAWQLPKEGKSGPALYQVIAVDKHGNFSVPAPVDINASQTIVTGKS